MQASHDGLRSLRHVSEDSSGEGSTPGRGDQSQWVEL